MLLLIDLLVPLANGITMKKEVIHYDRVRLGGGCRSEAEPEGLLHIQGQASLVKVPEEEGKGLYPFEKTKEPHSDLVVYGATKNKVLLHLDLLKMAQLANPIYPVNLVICLHPKFMNQLGTGQGE